MAGPLGSGTFVPPLLHVSDAIDPTLWAWLSDKIDHVLGVSPGVFVAIVGTLVVVFPIVVMVLGIRRRGEMGR